MQTTQLRVTIPLELQAYLRTKANKFGLNMSAYVKNLIIDDVREMTYPVYTASAKTEKAYREAKSEERTGKLISVDNLEQFLKDL
ncbi:MAG: hypothetical protein A3A82_00510 [Candidatus Pacebacteria bacterium RIFCSPLOWO2_01_FULL_47_12]|nr:MAG: hypothetical protein A3J60_01980 [Candidatus Pacebacteria bacterium RIFCSPHIGHO2_02_FULL_46_9]OGJ39370.1 MAG: hypothetical protein A3A82_00510 [Candidatus Pacebacteria bacterium RIFCSPLOWO2_01_FULL_47_12]